jgi:hypothetical protein
MSRITKKEREIVKRMDSIRALLKKFGLRLRAYDPGITAQDSQYRTYDFSKHEWEWLEPILKQAIGRKP